jgi:hypothetical protein
MLGWLVLAVVERQTSTCWCGTVSDGWWWLADSEQSVVRCHFVSCCLLSVFYAGFSFVHTWAGSFVLLIGGNDDRAWP